MSSAGPNNGSSFVDDASVGTVAWSNPANAQYSDNVYASVTLNSGIISHYLKATGFGFSIPSNATINGILVEVERKAAAGTIGDYSVKLVKGGAISGNNKADTTNNWPTTDTYKSYGGSTDLWGLSWTAADINASNFGMAIACRGYAANSISYIDHIRITVYYTAVNTYTYTGSGLIQTSGSASVSKTKSYVGSGQIQTSGQAVISKTKAYVGSGLIQTSGQAAVSKTKAYIGSGLIQTSGQAQTSKFRIFSYIGGGLIQVSGQALLSKVKAYIGSGQIQTGGTASVSKIKNYVGGGLIQTSGQAIISKTKAYVGSGKIQTGGTALVSKIKSYIGSGLVKVGGSAIAKAFLFRWKVEVNKASYKPVTVNKATYIPAHIEKEGYVQTEVKKYP